MEFFFSGSKSYQVRTYSEFFLLLQGSSASLQKEQTIKIFNVEKF